MGLSTSQLRDVWDPPCNSGSFITIGLHGDGNVTVDRRTQEAVVRLNDILVKWDYRTRASDTGAYNCREITGGGGYSLHAYGIALDLNWTTNPYGPNLITDMPRGMCDEITALRTGNGKRVWEWGGNWSNNKDAMHYEIDCSPGDLATGIQGGTKPTPIPLPEKGNPMSATFVLLDDVGRAVIIDNVMYAFSTSAHYDEARKASPDVPELHIGKSHDLRNYWDRLDAASRASQT